MSGPARGRALPRAVAGGGLALQLLSLLERLSSHRLFDRLIRGRTWIGLVAFALIGIVTLQLALLKLNGGVGRALEHEAMLQRENAALAIENSEMASAPRVQAHATQLGMVLAPTSKLRFLSARSRTNVGRAAAALASHSSAEVASAEEGASSSAASSSQEEQSSSGASEASPGSEGSEASESSESSHSSEGASSSESSQGAEASAPASTSSGSGEASSAGGSEAGSGE